MIKNIQILSVSDNASLASHLNKITRTGASILDFNSDYDNDTAHVEVSIPDMVAWKKLVDDDGLIVE